MMGPPITDEPASARLERSSTMEVPKENARNLA